MDPTSVTGVASQLIQNGPIGILVLVILFMFVGMGWMLAKAMPAFREFLAGLVAELKSLSAKVDAGHARIDLAEERLSSQIKLSEEHVKAHLTNALHGVEEEVRAAASSTGERLAVTMNHAVDVLKRHPTDPGFQAVTDTPREGSWEHRSVALTPQAGMAPIRSSSATGSRPGRRQHGSRPDQG